jgi:hypothetical protein
MESSPNFQLKANALEIIQNYRVPDLQVNLPFPLQFRTRKYSFIQALLKYARLSQQGNKRELFQRCRILLSSNVSSQLLNKINQIELTRINATKSHHSSALRNVIPPPPPTPAIHTLPSPNQIQYVHLPFFEKMRTMDCINIPVDWNTFPPLRLVLTDFDVDLILKGLAKVLLRIAPTILSDKQNDVLPPYLFIQCNVSFRFQSKTIGLIFFFSRVK